MTDDAQVPDLGADASRVEQCVRRLVDHLTATSALQTRAWREAVLATPRHIFTPRFYRPDPATGVLTLVTPTDREWLDHVYSDEPLVTQFNEDPAATGGIPTSSSTAPNLMLRMLEALEVQDGNRVLEIGTGTGYNAALLCRRLGDDSVTTVDIDEALTRDARDRLAQLGHRPLVVTGDGADGNPGNGPYDRIIATCAVRRIPVAWLDQVAPGGRIMVTLETSLHGYGLALLTVDCDNRGRGRILDLPASFMPMRSHADPAYAALRLGAAPAAGPPRQSQITSADLDSGDARFVLGLALPDIASFAISDEGGDGLHLAHHTDGSWAELSPDGTVVHGGQRDLWQVLETAHQDWTAAGRPAPHQFEITAMGGQQMLRLSDSDLAYELRAG